MNRKTIQQLMSILLICGISFLSHKAAAEPLELLEGKVLLGAEARVRFEYFDDTDFTSADDQREFVLTRVRPYIELRPHQAVSIFFEPQFTGAWGESGLSLTSVNPGTDGTTAATSGALNDPALGVHQAYLAYQPVDWFWLKAGRQELIYGDELLLGAVAWHNVGRSFDALKLRFKTDPTWVDLFVSFLSDAESGQARGVPTGSLGDAYLFGLYSSTDFGPIMEAFDIYALYLFDDTSNPRPFNFATMGARLKSKPSSVDYRLEATGQFGKAVRSGLNANQRDWQANAELGYTLASLRSLRFAVEGFLASENYMQLFPTAHKWLGYLDLFSRRNVMGGILHISAKPSQRWFVKLDTHAIFRMKNSSGLFRLNGVTPIGATGPSASHFAGIESDLTLKFSPVELLSFQTGFSAFVPTGFIKTNVGSEVPLFGYLQGEVKF